MFSTPARRTPSRWWSLAAVGLATVLLTPPGLAHATPTATANPATSAVTARMIRRTTDAGATDQLPPTGPPARRGASGVAPADKPEPAGSVSA